jgi:hypothetical protein
VACRDWIYRGERTTAPPVGLIVEAIMRHAIGPPAPAGGPPIPAAQAAVPTNLRRYFTAAATTHPEPPCCPPDVEADCCGAEQKEVCCGPGETPALCGCNA